MSLPSPSPLVVFLFPVYFFLSDSAQSCVFSFWQSFSLILQDVQLKVKAYILGTDMSNFKYDDFIVVLDVISRYATRVRGASSSSSPLIGLHYACYHRSPSCLVFFFFFLNFQFQFWCRFTCSVYFLPLCLSQYSFPHSRLKWTHKTHKNKPANLSEKTTRSSVSHWLWLHACWSCNYYISYILIPILVPALYFKQAGTGATKIRENCEMHKKYVLLLLYIITAFQH